MVKLSVILNLTQIKNNDYCFINNLNNQSLSDMEIIILLSKQNEASLQKYRNHYKDKKKISFYLDSDFKDLFNKYPHLIRGEYVYFAQDDTILSSSTFNNIYKYAIENQSDIQVCNYNIEGQNKNSNTSIYYSTLKNNETFRPKEKSTTLFNIVVPEISNYFYKTSFMQQNNLFDDYFAGETKIFFILKALICAHNISYFHKSSITYRHYFGHNITNWHEILETLDAVYLYLQQNELTDLYLQSFLNCYIDSLYFLIQGCINEPMHSELVRYIRFNIEKKYHLLRYASNYFHNTTAYKEYQFLFHKDLSNYKLQNIQKQFENNVNLVLATDEQLAPYTGITLSSLLENASEKNFYNVYILHNTISETIRTRLSSYGRCNFNVCFIDIFQKLADMNINHFSAFQNQSIINILIPQLFPQDRKIIYVDAFVQYLQDIADLNKTDIRGQCVIQIPSTSTNTSLAAQARVLIYNPYICNKKLFSEKCFILYKNYRDKASFGDLADIAKFCKRDLTENNKTLYRSISPKSLCMDECSVDAKWWQYARKTEFYEWILYNFFTNKTSSK